MKSRTNRSRHQKRNYKKSKRNHNSRRYKSQRGAGQNCEDKMYSRKDMKDIWYLGKKDNPKYSPEMSQDINSVHTLLVKMQNAFNAHENQTKQKKKQVGHLLKNKCVTKDVMVQLVEFAKTHKIIDDNELILPGDKPARPAPPPTNSQNNKNANTASLNRVRTGAVPDGGEFGTAV